jgi:hypothetical protein
MRNGVIEFPEPDDPQLIRKPIRPMQGKIFKPGENYAGCAEAELERLLEEPEVVAYPDAQALLGGAQ